MTRPLPLDFKAAGSLPCEQGDRMSRSAAPVSTASPAEILERIKTDRGAAR